MNINPDQNDELYFHSAVKYTALLATALQLLLTFYFLFNDLLSFSLLHLLNCLFFLLLFYWQKNKGQSAKVFYIMYIEIILQSIFSAILLGNKSGFLSYIPVLTMLSLLNPRWSVRMVIYFFIFNLFLYSSSTYIIGLNEPLISLSSEKLRSIYLLNVTLVAIVAFTLMVFFKSLNVTNSRILIDANKMLHKKNQEIEKQYRKQKILLKEIHHRVKNNLQVISSMLSLQKYKLEDEDMIAILENSQSRIHAISVIHQKLFQQEDVAVVNLNFYLKDLTDSLNHLNPNIECNIQAMDLSLHLDVAVPLGLITSELLSNCYKHAFDVDKKGKVDIILSRKDGDSFSLTITDNGKGFKKDFDPKNSTGLGMEIIQTLSEQIDAKVAFKSTQYGALSSIEFQLTDYRLIG